jgi:hypothetical protein
LQPGLNQQTPGGIKDLNPHNFAPGGGIKHNAFVNLDRPAQFLSPSISGVPEGTWRNIIVRPLGVLDGG